MGKRTSVVRHCLRCQQPFKTTPSRMAEGKGKYCSRKGIQSPRLRRTCLQCGTTFTANPNRVEAGRAKFCSRRCKYLHRRRDVIAVCESCGAAFSKKASHKTKFCSRKCAHAAMRSQVPRRCAVCGSEFFATPADLARGSGRYCSRKCKGEGSRSPDTRRCGTCGEEFRAPPSREQVYCSPQCNPFHRKKEGEPARPHSTNYGYVDYLWKGHPLANKSGTIMEHWIVFFQEHHYANWVIRARKIGATLHHKNGKRNDNRPENLELRWPGRHPYGWTTDAMIETLEMMGFVVRRPN